MPSEYIQKNRQGDLDFSFHIFDMKVKGGRNYQRIRATCCIIKYPKIWENQIVGFPNERKRLFASFFRSILTRSDFNVGGVNDATGARAREPVQDRVHGLGGCRGHRKTESLKF